MKINTDEKGKKDFETRNYGTLGTIVKNEAGKFEADRKKRGLEIELKTIEIRTKDELYNTQAEEKREGTLETEMKDEADGKIKRHLRNQK